MKPFILASSSPRRRELLEQVHYSFHIQPSQIEETINTASASEAVMQLAEQKAKDVWQSARDSVVLGSDTVVAYREQILGKPTSADDAREMLSLLSGATHEVYTGVSIYSADKVATFYEKTAVEFYPLSAQEIDWYIRSGEPFDKAGSYGIQGLGAYFVKQIRGDYFSVVGLPLARTMRALAEVGIEPGIQGNNQS